MNLLNIIKDKITKIIIDISSNNNYIENSEYTFVTESYPIVELEMHYPTIDRPDSNELRCYEHIKFSLFLHK